MTKFKLGMAAAAAAVLAFGVAACGQTTTVEEPAADSAADSSMAPAEAPADSSMAPADSTAAPADSTAPATTP